MRQRLSPRDTIVVVISGTTTAPTSSWRDAKPGPSSVLAAASAGSGWGEGEVGEGGDTDFAGEPLGLGLAPVLPSLGAGGKARATELRRAGGGAGAPGRGAG